MRLKKFHGTSTPPLSSSRCYNLFRVVVVVVVVVVVGGGGGVGFLKGVYNEVLTVAVESRE